MKHPVPEVERDEPLSVWSVKEAAHATKDRALVLCLIVMFFVCISLLAFNRQAYKALLEQKPVVVGIDYETKSIQVLSTEALLSDPDVLCGFLKNWAKWHYARTPGSVENFQQS